jgi:methionyl-tRNA synthetase
VIAAFLAPVMPTASRALLAQIGIPDEIVNWNIVRRWGLLPAGTQLPEPHPIFPRAELTLDELDVPTIKNAEPDKEKKVTEDTVKTEQQTLENPPLITKNLEYISIDDFMKVQLRVATILSAEPVPNATKLLKLTVEVGDEQRTILAGIAEMYQPDELTGRQIVVVANLQPRKMRGIESQGMLLAADVDGQAILLQPETKVPNGSRVR